MEKSRTSEPISIAIALLCVCASVSTASGGLVIGRPGAVFFTGSNYFRNSESIYFQINYGAFDSTSVLDLPNQPETPIVFTLTHPGEGNPPAAGNAKSNHQLYSFLLRSANGQWPQSSGAGLFDPTEVVGTQAPAPIAAPAVE